MIKNSQLVVLEAPSVRVFKPRTNMTAREAAAQAAFLLATALLIDPTIDFGALLDEVQQ